VTTGRDHSVVLVDIAFSANGVRLSQRQAL
jgi:hypothetical protein